MLLQTVTQICSLNTSGKDRKDGGSTERGMTLNTYKKMIAAKKLSLRKRYIMCPEGKNGCEMQSKRAKNNNLKSRMMLLFF